MSESMAPTAATLEDTKIVRLDQLKPHPLNYLIHTEEEIEEIITSVKEHGFYKPVITAKDLTILAGHGVSLALMKMGREYVEIIEKDYEPRDPRALKLLVGDNEIGHMAERDDRVLSELLKEILDVTNLLGTGYDPAMLANLALVTRTAQEMPTREDASKWANLPEYQTSSEKVRVTVQFPTEQDKCDFGKVIGVDMTDVPNDGIASVVWWPHKVTHDLQSARFTNPEEKPLTFAPDGVLKEKPDVTDLDEGGSLD